MNALLITPEDIKDFTIMSGNLDEDKFVYCIKQAQDLDLQDKLGSNLLEKIEADILAGSLADPYLALVKTFVKPCLIHFAMARFLPYAPYTVANKGVFKHSSENSEGVGVREIKELIEHEQNLAEHYTSRMVAYICANASDFPEYNTNTSEDMTPSVDTFTHGWLLD